MKQASVPLYIRFGRIPESGKSRIHLSDDSNFEEPGLSVWKAVECCGMYFPVLPEDANENAIMDYFEFLIRQDRPVYLVTGQEMRFEGQDREPLLMNVTVLKELTHYYKTEFWR